MLTSNLTRLFVTSAFLVSIQSFSSTELPAKGRFVITQKGDELIDGSQASITWLFNLDGKGRASLKISSWHAPYTCDGVYQVVQEGKQLKFIWKESSNPDGECNTLSPQFIMEKEAGNQWHIKSELFPWGKGGWENIENVGGG
ncbi:hypothetical protein [Yersinia kristensenii]|uniref:hypothetical protein n=1 Tax=Yersinia kristensenii TaxID=28152 RepID=UPI0011A4CDD7|nr:hypothetical protein [Yersinia kristensenii]